MKTKKADRVSITGAKAEAIRLLRYSCCALIGEQVEVIRVTLKCLVGSPEEVQVIYGTYGAVRSHTGKIHNFRMTIGLRRHESEGIWQACRNAQVIEIDHLCGVVSAGLCYSYDTRNRATEYCHAVRIDRPPKLGSKTVLLYQPAHGHCTRLRADY